MLERQKHRYLHITDTFTRRRDITSCSRIKQSHLGKCRNRILCTLTLVNDKILRTTALFASAFSNVNNVKIPDLFVFLVMFLFSSFCSHPRVICGCGVHFFNHSQNIRDRLWFSCGVVHCGKGLIYVFK